MSTIAEFEKRITKVADKEFLIEALMASIKDTEEIAISLQRQQLEEGYNRDEQEIGRYSRATELIYLFGGGRKPNKPKIEGELYNFDDTGSFLGGLKLIIENGVAYFTSSDEKTNELLVKYPNMFGLDPFNLNNYLKNAVIPRFIFRIRTELNLV